MSWIDKLEQRVGLRPAPEPEAYNHQEGDQP